MGDEIRPDTPQAINQLKHAGWQVGILSGDRDQIVQQVAKRLGIEQALGSMDSVGALRDRQNRTIPFERFNYQSYFKVPVDREAPIASKKAYV